MGKNFQFPISNFQSIIKFINYRIRKFGTNWKLETGNWKLGFTMIELLIVMAIVGVLATLFVATYPNARRRARDAQRQSDIRQYQTALEKYANKNNGSYYPSSGTINIKDQYSTLGLPASSPDDPGGTNRYKYNGNATQYVLWAQLEVSGAGFFIVCSNGSVGTAASAPGSPPACPL
jgi:prepilin-type N-terminal cleavage/methylation domain-containing protein